MIINYKALMLITSLMCISSTRFYAMDPEQQFEIAEKIATGILDKTPYAPLITCGFLVVGGTAAYLKYHFPRKTKSTNGNKSTSFFIRAVENNATSVINQHSPNLDNSFKSSIIEIGNSQNNDPNKSAIEIQRLFRGFSARKQFKNLKDDEKRTLSNIPNLESPENTAPTVQNTETSMDNSLEQIATKENLNNGKQATKKHPQMLGDVPYDDFEREFKAAYDTRIKRHAAATKIKSIFRGHLAQVEFQKNKNAEITIAKMVRGYQARKNIQHQTDAATKIQNAFRDHLTKRPLDEKKN